MAKKRTDYKLDNSFYVLADNVSRAIDGNEDGSDQAEQVERLMALEKSFKNGIWRFPRQAREIYKRFILMVMVENKSVLTARPYFRERSDSFTKYISPALKNGDVIGIKPFHFNFLFMEFVKKNWKGNMPERCEKLYRQTEEARRKLIENNMPLAINRAKLFYRKVPNNHIDLMDIIGIAASGLINGIDKWVGPYSKVFRSVCIGRMTGNINDDYNDTFIHFYPTDKSVIYRANSLKHRHRIEDIHTLTRAINESFTEDTSNGKKVPKANIKPEDLQDLLNASSVLSIDYQYGANVKNGEALGGGEGTVSISNILLDSEQDYSQNLEERAIVKNAWSKVHEGLSDLSVIQKKVLKMKGIKM